MTTVQKGPKKLVCPSAIYKGSNNLVGASFHGESLIKRNDSLTGSSYYTKDLVPDNVLKGVPSFRHKLLIGGEGDKYAQHACSQSETGNQPGLADFQRENDSVHLPKIYVQERGMDFNTLFCAFSRTIISVILLSLTC